MKKFKHIREITLIKNAFPMEWKEEFMELLNHPNEDWIRYPNNKKYGILYEGPKISKTSLGERWRNYAFQKWKDEFGIDNKLNDGYENSNGVYWGDFLLEFKEGHYLINHRDEHNPKELRFNVLLQKPKEGGIYKFNDTELKMDEGVTQVKCQRRISMIYDILQKSGYSSADNYINSSSKRESGITF